MSTWFKDAKGQVRNGWKVAAYMVAAMACFAAVGVSRHVIPAGVKQFLPNALLAVAAILLVTRMAVRLEGVSLANIGWRLDGRFFVQLAVGLAMGLGLIAVIAALVWGAGGFVLHPTPGVTSNLLTKSFLTFLGVAIFEEVIFRGYALQRAMRGMGTGGGVIVIGLLFTAGHLPGNTDIAPLMFVLAMLNIFLAACLLSFCYLRTGSLALPIGVHWGWNWLQGSLGFGVSGEGSHGWWTPDFGNAPTWLSGGEFGLEASAVATVVVTCAILVLAYWKNGVNAGGRMAQYRVSMEKA